MQLSEMHGWESLTSMPGVLQESDTQYMNSNKDYNSLPAVSWKIIHSEIFALYPSVSNTKIT